MNHLDRFLAVMEFETVDRVPNWELGAWAQTRTRWKGEGADVDSLHWNWFAGETTLGMDPREFIPFRGGMLPPFEAEVLEENEDTQVIRDEKGRVRRALKRGAIGGARASMDTYLAFPVQNAADWEQVKRRFDAADPARHAPDWREKLLPGWRVRQHPLIFAPNCQLLGFYWISRELMGTEGLSLAWYDQPELMHDIMEFWADFLIEAARPVLAETTVEYICLNEDMAMKTGPLLSPRSYDTFIAPRLRRVVEFFKANGVRYVCIDTDGNPEALVPSLMDCGIDVVWPLERAADQDPARLRRKFGRSLRLWGGVDKRVLAQDRDAILAHLRTLQPLVEEGGFIPTVDHTVPPDVSWDNFRFYMEAKEKLLRAEL